MHSTSPSRLRRLVPHLLGLTLALGVCFTPPARAATFDLSTATIADINAAFDAGALTSEKLVQLYLNRIAAYDKKGPNINAIITLNAKALETARELDAERKAKGPAFAPARHPGRPEGPLRHEGHAHLGGLPAVEKLPADSRCDGGSRGCAPRGAVILAKVNMSDWFGVPKKGDQSTVLGRTSNPYNLDLTPGGSSGGTGASLAAVLCADRPR